VFQLEAEAIGVEGHGSTDVRDLISNTMKTLHDGS
jgi:hypothetical protein